MSDKKSPSPLRSDYQVNYPADAELASFAQNIAALESILFRCDLESSSVNPDIQRLVIYASESSSIQGELIVQMQRAIGINGADDPNVARLLALEPRLTQIIARAEDRLSSLLRQRDEVEKRYTIEVAMLDDFVARARETPERASDILAEFNLQKNRAPTSPPPPPIDMQAESTDDGPMKRIEKLEDFANQAGQQLVRIETKLEGIEDRIATKGDLANLGLTMKGDLTNLGLAMKGDLAILESTMLKWFIATSLTLVSVVFVVAKYLH